MDKFDLLCLLESIKGFAHDIHYTAKGALFYNDHLFADRLADFYDRDEFIETFYLGEFESAPLSRMIAQKVGEITPETHADTQENFKVLFRLMAKALLAMDRFKAGTRGENSLLDGISQKLQVLSGLLYRQTNSEQIAMDERWITLHPNEENPEDYRRLKIDDGETTEEAIEKKFGKTEKKEPEKKEPEKEDKEKKEQKKYEIKEASTVKEAEELAKKANIADSINYGKLDLEYANTVNQSIAANLNEFPEVRKELAQLGSLQAVNKAIQEKSLKDNEERINKSIKDSVDNIKAWYGDDYINRVYGGEEKLVKKISDQVTNRYKRAFTRKATGEYANFTYGYKNENGGIRFNEKFKTKKNIEENLSRSSQAGWHPEKCNTLKSVVDHEFGHAIEYHVSEKSRTRGSKSYEDLKDYYRGLSATDIKEGLSRYAVTNFKEFVAEGYSEYKNNPNPRPISQKIGKLLTQSYQEVN